ncbi:MAG: hypothetical protein D6794_09695, partial [Deltaproteobacteria bacterium]
IVNNVTALAGGGISLQDAVNAEIVNNTIAFNDSAAVAALAFPPGNLSVSNPQPAGIASHANSTTLTAVGINGFSDPLLVNNIVWHNKSYYHDASLNGTMGGLVAASGHPTNAHDDYWDLGVLDTGNTADKLAPMSSILTDTTGYDASNSSSDPGFVRTYRNQLISAAILDEGGNFISLRYRQLQASLGDYHLSSLCSPAVDRGTATGAPADDIDGDTRPQGSGIDIGADEFSGTGWSEGAALTVLNPVKDELVAANSTYVVRWQAPSASMSSFDLFYRLRRGTRYQKINTTPVTNTCYAWNVPGNVRQENAVRLFVVEHTTRDKDRSPRFRIDALALQQPNGGEVLLGGNTYSILWDDKYAPNTTVSLYYRVQNANGTWGPYQTIGQAPSGDHRFDWSLPNLSYHLGQVMVVLSFWDAAQNKVVLLDASNQPFTILAGSPAVTTPAAAA